MCQICPAPRLEHNPLHAELSVTSFALTSSDKSDKGLFNHSVQQARAWQPQDRFCQADREDRMSSQHEVR